MAETLPDSRSAESRSLDTVGDAEAVGEDATGFRCATPARFGARSICPFLIPRFMNREPVLARPIDVK